VDRGAQRGNPVGRALAAQHHGGELALDRDGRFLAFQVRSFCNIGAYYTSDRSAGPPTNNIGVLAGTYVIRRSTSSHRGADQHHDDRPYRGAGRPEAAMWSRPWWTLRRGRRHRPRRAAPPQHDPGRRDAVQDALIYTYDCGDFGKNLKTA